tara:strand:+ start:4077 stop:5873 length:1797 start_codon:yes stop_codon:yes gene_type:complete
MNNSTYDNKNFRFIRLLIIIINDLIILNASISISYYLRIEYFINSFEIIKVHIASSIIYIILFFIFGIQKQFFRFFNSNSYNLYLKFFISYFFLFSIYVFFQNEDYLPRSLAIIFPSFFFGCLIFNRILVVKFLQNRFKFNRKKSVVFGFNPTNINSLLSYGKIACFVDDNKKNSKRIVNGIEILTSNRFNLVYKKFKFNQILIENEKTFDLSKNKIRDHIFEKNILVQKIIFRNNELLTKSYFNFNYFFNRISKISPIGSTYDNKVILITGAGGSIGSNIVIQLLKCKYKKLILLDNSEYNLYNLSSLIKNKSKIIFKLINFNNKEDVKKILTDNNVDIIFHAAAYKHVPIIENNPFSAIKNNFIDTFEFMMLISKYKVSNFCLISSDKAVRPTNIMGASKRLSELALIYLSNQKNHNTTFCSVRFGNVINSSGSVKPLFQYQIDNNLPVPLTHKNIIRYFMTIEEAANLVLCTIKISNGGETFLLDMGEPIKLYDLAKLMIQFSGKIYKKNGQGDIEIKIIGLRDGEKLYEELLIDRESKPSKIKSIYQSLELKINNKNFKEIYTKILRSYKMNDPKLLKKALKSNFVNYNLKNDS